MQSDLIVWCRDNIKQVPEGYPAHARLNEKSKDIPGIYTDSAFTPALRVFPASLSRERGGTAGAVVGAFA